MNRYERYKDSGIPWLGEVPEHWEIKRLKFLGDIILGLTYSPENITNEDNGTLVLRSSNIQNGKLVFEDNVFVNSDIPQKMITTEQDILICSRNGSRSLIGKCALIEKYGLNQTFGAFMTVYRTPYRKFVYYALNSEIFKSQLGLFLTSTINQLTTQVLGNFNIAFPPRDEQTAIAHYLDTKLGEIDALIDKQQMLLEKLAEQRTAVITHAVTKGLNPAAPVKNSGVEWLGDVPAHWDIERLKFIASVNKGKMPKELISENFDDFPTYLNMDYLRNGIATHFVVDRTVPVIDENEILLLWDGANAGEFIKSKKGVISSTIALIKFQDRIYKNFAWYACLVIERILRSSTIGMGIPHVNGEELKNSPIVLPPPEEQTAIAEYLDQETAKIDRLCETVNQTIGRLKEYRTALITQAVTGKIKVTDE